MKLRIHEHSLFAVLARAPWWVSFLVAGLVLAGARFVLPVQYAAAFAIPFAGIGAYAAWKQLRAPSAEQLAKTLEALRAMPAENFAFVLEETWRKHGYAVARHAGAGADYELEKGGRTVLVACRRWKATRTGVDPLKELKAAARARKADALYLAAGEVTAQARRFATDNAVTLVEGAEIAKLVPRAAQRA
ncbi:MAG: restriction endonuclease [Betaproteobacteria bacterium]|nr:restriction endonuclease [Betaproteobacteria bacterium]